MDFMKIALEMAKIAEIDGNFPVGAVLVINDQIIGKEHNNILSSKNWCNHAEANLIRKHGEKIRNEYQAGNKKIEVYTTLEPCLMCFGTMIMNRISKIYFACKDPSGGASNLSNKELPSWYNRHWPQVEQGKYFEESYSMLTKFMDKHPDKWKKIREEFSTLIPDVQN